MRSSEFQIFLTTRFRGRLTGEPLSKKAASDAASRCRRVEDVLGVDLDTALASDAQTTRLFSNLDPPGNARFRFQGNVHSALAALRHAVKLYSKFIGSGGRRK